MGRPPHVGRFSISLRASRKAALLFLQQGNIRTSEGGWAGGTCVRKAGGRKAHSRQLLQGALLVDLVGAVGNVRVEVPLCVVLQDVTDVLHTHL